jgi:hypothetical protein
MTLAEAKEKVVSVERLRNLEELAEELVLSGPPYRDEGTEFARGREDHMAWAQQIGVKMLRILRNK